MNLEVNVLYYLEAEICCFQLVYVQQLVIAKIFQNGTIYVVFF